MNPTTHPRRTILLAVSLVGILLPAAAHAATSAKLSGTFVPEHLGERTTLDFAFSFSDPGTPVPPPLTQVELTLKSKQELTAILRAWSRARHIEAVLYFAETVKIEEKLLDVIEELKAEDVVVVNPLSEVVKALPGFELGGELEPLEGR